MSKTKRRKYGMNETKTTEQTIKQENKWISKKYDQSIKERNKQTQFLKNETNRK